MASLFLVKDEGFVDPSVDGGTPVCGWLRYFENQVKKITRFSVSFISLLNYKYKLLTATWVVSQVTALSSYTAGAKLGQKLAHG